ncbi:MAG: type II toxin-antitoxin system prevent-host-death family antitoxin [Rickettsiaceae bacterium]|jgi:prevent-host-death family protein|nr:type II toxin-antitoxin system prevent-host-death family antitoxin [Rickettsiaceae bacterium]MDP5020551.1 type II toxin-antitoxin system prevent-host-death family antitoxin [Rickettsiaceae bacterium]MDP5082984.1 type II toxin-antitoxin system prevent-host-death family antitoxin [Rickettsiaceae bacterium]
MAKPISSFNAKTHLSNLLNQVEQGEEFIITRRNHPVARLIPLQNQLYEKNTANLIKEIKLARKFYSLNLADGINQLKLEGRK